MKNASEMNAIALAADASIRAKVIERADSFLNAEIAAFIEKRAHSGFYDTTISMSTLNATQREYIVERLTENGYTVEKTAGTFTYRISW